MPEKRVKKAENFGMYAKFHSFISFFQSYPESFLFSEKRQAPSGHKMKKSIRQIQFQKDENRTRNAEVTFLESISGWSIRSLTGILCARTRTCFNILGTPCKLAEEFDQSFLFFFFSARDFFPEDVSQDVFLRPVLWILHLFCNQESWNAQSLYTGRFPLER